MSHYHITDYIQYLIGVRFYQRNTVEVSGQSVLCASQGYLRKDEGEGEGQLSGVPLAREFNVVLAIQPLEVELGKKGGCRTWLQWGIQYLVDRHTSTQIYSTLNVSNLAK